MDKAKHFIASAAIVLIGTLFFGYGIIVVSYLCFISLLFGIAKEYFDWRSGGEFDWFDLIADICGIIFALSLSVK